MWDFIVKQNIKHNIDIYINSKIRYDCVSESSLGTFKIKQPCVKCACVCRLMNSRLSWYSSLHLTFF